MEILTKLQSEMLAILPEYEKLTSNEKKEEKNLLVALFYVFNNFAQLEL